MTEEIGASLFHGANSVHVQNGDQEEEEEDLEDQKRRQKELQNLIANAFDDIDYGDENSLVNSSCDDSVNISRAKYQETSVDTNYLEHIPNDSEYKNSSFNSMEQLQVLYQIRVREIKNLMNQLDTITSESKQERDMAQKKIMLLEADQQRNNISLKQSQSLLMEKNADLISKTKEIAGLKETVEDLRKSKEKNNEEMLYWKGTSDELQQRLTMVEKGLNSNLSEKHIRSHYEQEVHALQDALDMSSKKLENVERDFRNLQNDLKEAHHAREISLAEKAQIINSMTKSLEESQGHRHSLLSKVSGLQIENQSLQHELDLLKESYENKPNVTKDSKDELILTLRDELKRSLDAQIQKRNDIQKLELTLKELSQKECKLLEELKGKQSVENREMEQSKCIEELKKSRNDLLNENNMLQGRISELEKQLHELQEIQQKSNSTSKEIMSNDTSITNKSFYKEECNKLKVELDNLEKQLNDSKSWKERYSQLEEQCLKLQETLAQINSKFSESQVTIASLREKIALKEERDGLLDVLKQKAAMFEDYMTHKPPQIKSEDKSVNTDELIQPSGPNKTELLEIIATVENETCEKVKRLFQAKFTEFEQTVLRKTMQLNMLAEENKTLKDKIVFDRNAFTELTQMWTVESNKLNHSLQTIVEKNNELTRNVHKLGVEIQQKDILCISLNSQLADTQILIKKIKLASKRQEEHLQSEYDRISKKFQDLLVTIQKRVNNYISNERVKTSYVRK